MEPTKTPSPIEIDAKAKNEHLLILIKAMFFSMSTKKQRKFIRYLKDEIHSEEKALQRAVDPVIIDAKTIVISRLYKTLEILNPPDTND